MTTLSAIVELWKICYVLTDIFRPFSLSYFVNTHFQSHQNMKVYRCYNEKEKPKQEHRKTMKKNLETIGL